MLCIMNRIELMNDWFSIAQQIVSLYLTVIGIYGLVYLCHIGMQWRMNRENKISCMFGCSTLSVASLFGSIIYIGIVRIVGGSPVLWLIAGVLLSISMTWIIVSKKSLYREIMKD